MISYELAKKLKEAGFPQEPFKLKVGSGGTLKESRESEVRMSNLSELIKECGSNFRSLFHELIESGSIWVALAGSGEQQQGKTPEEAVANLWFALNEGQKKERVLE